MHNKDTNTTNKKPSHLQYGEEVFFCLMNRHEPGFTKWHENQRDKAALALSEAKNVPPIGVAFAGTKISSISAIDGVF